MMSENLNPAANTKAWPQSIQAITLFAEDLEQTVKFYEKVFGLPIHFADSNSAVFKFGGTFVNLLRILEANELIAPARVADRDSGSRIVFTIGVEDVDAMCAEFASRGVQLLNGPMDRPWGIRTASFMDPAGNIWEIAK
jgi:catechol 2,3-dioxygenase-like lactoylglutathione lyase family enzyme